MLTQQMFTKLLIANRGEIACRIIKTAQAESAICGTHLGDTKLPASIRLSPASARDSIKAIFAAVGTATSFCKPSRGPISKMLTLSDAE